MTDRRTADLRRAAGAVGGGLAPAVVPWVDAMVVFASQEGVESPRGESRRIEANRIQLLSSFVLVSPFCLLPFAMERDLFTSSQKDADAN